MRILKERVRRQEVVIIGAHYDSVTGSPGANDNGSGVSALLELSRLSFALDTDRKSSSFCEDCRTKMEKHKKRTLRSVSEQKRKYGRGGKMERPAGRGCVIQFCVPALPGTISSRLKPV